MAYATVERLKLYLSIGDDSDDVLLDDCIDRAQQAIDTYTARIFEAASATRYYGSDAVDSQWLYVDEDLYSLTSVANGDASGTAVSTDDITLWCGDSRNAGPPYNKLRLDENSTSVWEVDTDYYIEVTALWGYSASAPADIVQACVRWAAYFYRQKDTGQFDAVAVGEGGTLTVPTGMPEDVRVMLAPYVRRTR